MPFMRGPMPVRRTINYLNRGTIFFRDNLRIFTIGYHGRPTALQQGAKDFVYWHWAQLQYKNPKVQLVRYNNISKTPFVQAFLEDGDSVVIDLEGKDRGEILDQIVKVLGKTSLVLRREKMEQQFARNDANFGSDYERQCICVVQGQHPCPRMVPVPQYLKGRWRWHKSLP